LHVAKSGNSLAVRLPKALVEALGLRAGDEVELSPLPGGGTEFNVPAQEGYKFDREEARASGERLLPRAGRLNCCDIRTMISARLPDIIGGENAGREVGQQSRG